MLYKSNLELCKPDDRGFFEGYANVFGHVDSQGDCVLRGAFQKTINAWRQLKRYPGMYLNHNMSVPLGQWTNIDEDEYGLYVSGKLLFDLPMSLSINALMQKTSLGLSVGIEVLQSVVRNGVRYIYEAKLCEISLTKQPANTKSRVFARFY